MRTRVMLALGVFTSLAMMAGSCSKSGPGSSGVNGGPSNPLAPVAMTPTAPDSNPNHPPHPPHPNPRPSIPDVEFIDADSSAAGDSVVATRWQLGNDSKKAFTMPWTLTSTRNWPGFPKSGSVALGARSAELLIVTVAVPDTAAPGPNPLTMTVTLQSGTTATAVGGIQVIGP